MKKGIQRKRMHKCYVSNSPTDLQNKKKEKIQLIGPHERY